MKTWRSLTKLHISTQITKPQIKFPDPAHECARSCSWDAHLTVDECLEPSNNQLVALLKAILHPTIIPCSQEEIFPIIPSCGEACAKPVHHSPRPQKILGNKFLLPQHFWARGLRWTGFAHAEHRSAQVIINMLRWGHKVYTGPAQRRC